MNWWSSLGLIFDIAGAILLFTNVLPPNVSVTGGVKFNQKPQQKEESRRVAILARIGFCLIVLGFILQFIGTNSFVSEKISKSLGF